MIGTAYTSIYFTILYSSIVNSNIAFPTLTWTNITTEVDPYTNIVSAEIEYTLPNQDGVSTEVGIATISKNTPLTEASR